MYLENIDYVNDGPVERLSYKFRKDSNGCPIPLVVVGQNGSGKSLIFSSIVDALFEISEKSFRNTWLPNEEGVGRQYYKSISEDEIRIGASFLLSKIKFEHDGNEVDYVFKTGKIKPTECRDKCGFDVSNDFQWNEFGHYKKVNATSEFADKAFDNSVICSFLPERYAKPSWIGDGYYKHLKLPTFSAKEKLVSVLSTPIVAENYSEIIKQWLCDVVADSRTDQYAYLFEKNPEKSGINFSHLWQKTRSNVEKIFSIVLGKEVGISLRDRFWSDRRLMIFSKKTGNLIVPCFEALSTGQLAVLNIFFTILRYGESKININSIDLEKISGIVIIDEIDLHLHLSMQAEVLPKLMKLFPRVQFVVASHSPLFLLGMKDTYGTNGVDIVEMPCGNRITAEQFCEFKTTYKQLVETTIVKTEVERISSAHDHCTVIVTEGATDWRHMEAAFVDLTQKKQLPEIFQKGKIEFLRFDSGKNRKKHPLSVDLEMGNHMMAKLCEALSKINNGASVIFIADCDDEEITERLSDNHGVKFWGNGIYSLCLPVPSYRNSTPNISIEHLYKDDDLKKTIVVDEIPRRIFTEDEFDVNGEGHGIAYRCLNLCHNKERYGVIGGDKKTVIRTGSHEVTNYALSKMAFAESVLNKVKPFDQMDFSGFIPLFEEIASILRQNREQ